MRGDLLVLLSTDRTSRLDPGSVLVTARGPLTVVSASPHQDRWIVHFEGISDRDDAENWRGVVLQADSIDSPADDEALWVHQLIGSSVELIDGTPVGTVAYVQANPASDLLVLDDGALVPVVFITDRRPGWVTIDPPEGLFDL